MSNQAEQSDLGVDEIPIDVSTTRTSKVDPPDVPAGIRAITRGLASEQPPTSPLVVLKVARWWYIHGRGGADPVFQWALEWTLHLATDRPGDVDRFDDFRASLVALGFADDTAELRDFSESRSKTYAEPSLPTDGVFVRGAPTTASVLSSAIDAARLSLEVLDSRRERTNAGLVATE